MTQEEYRLFKLDEIAKLPTVQGFKIPEGMYIPFGYDVLVKEVTQEEIVTDTGIILSTGTRRTVGASIGTIYAIGELCQKPLHLGMKIYFDPGVQLCVFHKGTPYLQMNEGLVLGAVTPATYLTPYVADSNAKRREKRNDGVAAADKRDNDKLETSFEQRETMLKKEDYIPKKERVITIKTK